MPTDHLPSHIGVPSNILCAVVLADYCCRVRTRRCAAVRSRACAAVLAIVIPLILLSTRGVLEESNGGACDDISLPIPLYNVTPAVLIVHLEGPSSLPTDETAHASVPGYRFFTAVA